MNTTTIEWAEKTWNPVTGCTPVSEGCEHCYARKQAQRFRGRFGYPEDDPFKVTRHDNRLLQPLKLRKPSRIFVCSMGDLFHDDVGYSIVDIFDVMSATPQHTYILLTKRPERMRSLFRLNGPLLGSEPLPNVWLGVTAENQQRADERIPVLLQIPAAVRFASIEPMLGPVDLSYLDLGDQLTCGYGPRRIVWDALSGWESQYEPGCRPKPMPEQFPKCMRNTIGGRLDWVICGGETGPGARPMRSDWARSLRDQCQDAQVPFFFKQIGGPRRRPNDGLLDGREWDEHPEVEP